MAKSDQWDVIGCFCTQGLDGGDPEDRGAPIEELSGT